MIVIELFPPPYLHDFNSLGYLQAYDPDFGPEDAPATGDAKTTRDPREALQFPSFDDALQFTMRISKRRPSRADGEPNRPIRAFTITFVPLAEAIADAANREKGK